MTQSKLRATWSKREQDVMIHFPRKCDGHYLSGVFDKQFIQEMRQRGYDLTTLRFSIERNQAGESAE